MLLLKGQKPLFYAPGLQLKSMTDNDTIAAVATANGRGAVAMVRVSGPKTKAAIQLCCGSKTNDIIARPRQMIRVRIIVSPADHTDTDANDGYIDDGLVVFFAAPNSYTGEDVAEFFLHGSPLISRKLLTILSNQLSIRPALPGEFTRRAFQNGQMDLTAAESVRRLVDAKSEYELQGAQRLYSGELKKTISRFRSALMNLKAETEAEVDFSDEDLTFESKSARSNRVHDLIRQIDLILKRSGAAEKVSNGFRIALVGVTNAGKSSLLNRLLGWDRSIVSDIHGTTRDYIAEDVEISDYRIRFIDTAGLRSTDDMIEKEGIRRSVDEMQRSDLILHLIDGSLASLELNEALAFELDHSQESKKIFHIVNKVDILHPNANSSSYFEKLHRPGYEPELIRISCKTGQGVEELHRRIVEHLEQKPGGLDPFLLEERHRHHFGQMKDALQKLLGLWNENAPDEIAALEIDTALRNAADITGEITTEDILGRIFSLFCVGK